MSEAFHVGGWPMYPILVSGLLACAAAIRYAVHPERRQTPLLLSLGLVTLLWGAVGFTLGMIHSLSHLHQVPPEQRFIVLLGLGESLYDVAFALLWVLLSAMIAAIGAWRLAGSPGPALPEPPLSA